MSAPSVAQRRILFAIFGLLVVAALCLGAWQGMRYRGYLAQERGIPPTQVTLFNADYWMGELVEGVVRRGEYRGCYDSTASAQPATVGLCMSAHRMPVPTLFMAAVAVVFNDVVFYVAIKCALGMALLCLAAWLVLRQSSDWRAPDWRTIAAGLVAVWLLSPPNIQIFFGTVTEESFFIPQMALAGALLFSRRSARDEAPSNAAVCGLAVLLATMVMTKSSALLPSAALAVLFALKTRTRGPAMLLPLASLAAVLLAWGAFTWHATGRFAFGSDMSSLNGYNLHHGYTIHYGEVAPRYHLDLPVSRGQINLNAPVRDEWEMNQQFKDRVVAFVKDHPGLTAWYFVLKGYAALIKLTPEYRLQSGEDGFFLPKHLILTAGLILDRLVLWLSLAAAVTICWLALRREGLRGLFGPKAFDSTVMLAVSAAFLLPFMTAFSTYRHIVPLYYFQMSYLAALVLRPSLLEETRWGVRLLGWARG